MTMEVMRARYRVLLEIEVETPSQDLIATAKRVREKTLKALIDDGQHPLAPEYLVPIRVSVEKCEKKDI